jgi:cytochrome c-type biogenesis protein CcmH
MLIFFFICALMVLLALFLILPPLFESEAGENTDEARAANLLVYQDQLRELQADLKAGLLSEAQYEQDKEELERRLLEDVGTAKQSPGTFKKIATRKLGYAVAVAIPIAAILFYLVVGKPKALEPAPPPPPNLRAR